MRNKNPFLTLFCPEIMGAAYEPTLTIEFGSAYMTYIQQPGGKRKLFDRKYRSFMWSGNTTVLLVSIEGGYVYRMTNSFTTKAGETWYDEIKEKFMVKVYKTHRSTPADIFIRKVGA
jgi:hypothetical protein